jgi:hypothetical protein
MASKRSKKEKKAAEPAASKTQPRSLPTVKPGIFSPGQFTFLVLISMGISRLLQVRSSYGHGEDSSGTEPDKAVATCVEHLGAVACLDSSIQSLLKLKFHSALQLTALAGSMALQSWNSEPILQQLNSLFIISPMGAGIAAMAYSDTISQALVWRQALVCFVLAVLAAPQVSNFPFTGKRFNRVKSLSSMALLGLALSNVFRVVHFVTLAIGQKSQAPSSASPFVINPFLYYQLSTDIAKAAHPIVLFLAVDALTAALVYALSWYSLPDGSQRVSHSCHVRMIQCWSLADKSFTVLSCCVTSKAMLLLTAAMKLVEYFVELPCYQDDVLFNTEPLKTTVLTIAFVAGVGWIAPPISFKKRLGKPQL